MQGKTASIGGDGVIITDKKVDIYAFNQGVTMQGSDTVWGNTVNYTETTRNNTLYIPQITLYAYVIKRVK